MASQDRWIRSPTVVNLQLKQRQSRSSIIHANHFKRYCDGLPTDFASGGSGGQILAFGGARGRWRQRDFRWRLEHPLTVLLAASVSSSGGRGSDGGDEEAGIAAAAPT